MMTPPALGQEIYSRGFRFNPTPREAVKYYLPRLISGEPLHEVVRPVIHHADVHACSPADLARWYRPMPRTGDRFFFAPCKKAVHAANSPSSWAAQTTVKIMENKVLIGELRKLRYKKRGVLTDWLMEEYSSCGVNHKQQQFVFCKMYVSPRAAPSSDAHDESAAFFALPPRPPATPATAVIAQPVAKRTAPLPPQAAMPPCAKRTAPLPPQAAMPPCAKRMRGPVAQPAPQPQAQATPAPIRSPLTAVRKLYFAPPPQPCAPLRGSPAPSVTQTQPSPAPIEASAPPALIRPVVEPCRSPMPAPAPARALARPMQQVPLPTPPVVHAFCHMPRQALAPPCQPQVSAQSKQTKILDPFEAAIVREQAEAAAPDPPPSKQFPAAAPVLQDEDDDDLVQDLEDAMLRAEAEDQTVAAALQEEEEDEDNWDDLAEALELVE